MASDDDNLTQVKVRLPAHLKAALEHAARENGWSTNQEVVARIAAGLGQADNAMLAEENIAASLAILVANRKKANHIRRRLMRRLAEVSPGDPLLSEIIDELFAGNINAPSEDISDLGPATPGPAEAIPSKSVRQADLRPKKAAPRRRA